MVESKQNKLEIGKDLDKLIDSLPRQKDSQSEMDFDNCNVQLKQKPVSMNTPSARKRAAYNFIEQTMTNDSSPHTTTINKEPLALNKETIETKTTKEVEKKPAEYESRRKKPVSSLLGDMDNPLKMDQEQPQKRHHNIQPNREDSHKTTSFNLNKYNGDAMIYDSRRHSNIFSDIVSKINHDNGLHQFNK